MNKCIVPYVEGSGEMQDCDDSTCRFGGKCIEDFSGASDCQCPFSCEAIR